MEKVYQTGDQVPETGMYVCAQNGLEKSFNEGETFDVCPVTWQNTQWSAKEKEK